jgi:hypothetical protein
MNFKMKSLFSLGLLGFLMAVAPVAHANDITYDVDETIGSNSVVGTITTVAGVTGALTSADIVSTDLTFDGALEIDDPTGALTQVTGDDLTETATALYFNFSDSAVGYFIPDALSVSDDEWRNATVGAEPDYSPAGFQGIYYIPVVQSEGVTGDVAIATAAPSVPEPSSFFLTLTGMLILGLMRKRIVTTLG